MKFVVKDSCENRQARVVIFAMVVVNDMLFRRNVNQPPAAYSSLYESIFFISIF